MAVNRQRKSAARLELLESAAIRKDEENQVSNVQVRVSGECYNCKVIEFGIVMHVSSYR